MAPNKHLCDTLVMALTVGDSPMPGGIFVSSTELYSYANMVVLGKQVFVFSHNGQFATVQAFSEEVKALPGVPIVDAVIAYDKIFGE